MKLTFPTLFVMTWSHGILPFRLSEAFQRPWRTLFHSNEQYCLRYESKFLAKLGESMNYLYNMAMSVVAQEALKYTILSSKITCYYFFGFDHDARIMYFRYSKLLVLLSIYFNFLFGQV